MDQNDNTTNLKTDFTVSELEGAAAAADLSDLELTVAIRRCAKSGKPHRDTLTLLIAERMRRVLSGSGGETHIGVVTDVTLH